MSSTRRTNDAARRRPSPAVYRRRRLVAVLLLLAIVAAVVLAIWHPWSRGGAAAPAPTLAPTGSALASPSPTPTAPSAPPTGDASGEATSAPAPAPSASGTAPGIAACTTSDISVLAVTDKDSYGAGEQPQLSISLSNTSSNPCLINVGTATQAFVITSGTDTWWRSTDCQSESSDQVVQLAAGQTVASVTPLVWDRTRSSVDTCDSTSRPTAGPGYYHLQVSIGGIVGADTKMFDLQ